MAFKQFSHETSAYLVNRHWWTQSKPYSKPLPFAFHAQVTNSASSEYAHRALQQGKESHEIYAQAKAYEGFKEKVAKSAEIGSALATWRSSASMINSRARSLLLLGERVGRKVTKHKQFSNLWLEYSFGWKPLIDDIFGGLEVLSADLPYGKVRARAKYIERATFPGVVPTRERWAVDYKTSVLIQSDVQVSNPNLFLLNQMGLINPLTVAWELTPWSFVVDWFVNVQQTLARVSDFAGLELTNSFTTVYHHTYSNYKWIEPDGSIYQWFDGDDWSVQRSLGIQGPRLHFRPFHGWSVTRGANAIALLLQQFRR